MYSIYNTHRSFVYQFPFGDFGYIRFRQVHEVIFMIQNTLKK